VRWKGADPAGGASLNNYTVQYQQGTSAWTDWLIGTVQTEADFAGQDGQSYKFRVQSVDWVGNPSAWLESGPVSVKAVTKYYLFNGQRVAMRRGEGATLASPVAYLHSDPLSSVSAITGSSGAVLSETRYDPFGVVRWTSGATVTDLGYTGQRADGMGLMDYNARFYSPSIMQWTSPDSLIPDPYNPLDWNRYAYVRFNSLTCVNRYTNLVAGQPVYPHGHRAPQQRKSNRHRLCNRCRINFSFPIRERSVPGGLAKQ